MIRLSSLVPFFSGLPLASAFLLHIIVRVSIYELSAPAPQLWEDLVTLMAATAQRSSVLVKAVVRAGEVATATRMVALLPCLAVFLPGLVDMEAMAAAGRHLLTPVTISVPSSLSRSSTQITRLRSTRSLRGPHAGGDPATAYASPPTLMVPTASSLITVGG